MTNRLRENIMKNLAQLLTDHVNGSTFIAITSHTDARTSKTLGRDPETKQWISNPHYNRVTKVTEGMNVMVFQNKTTNAYENMVNKRLAAEGKSTEAFTLGPRKWGVRVPNTCFIEHNENFHIEVIVLKAGTTTYLLDGQPIDKKDIQGLPKAKPSVGQQGGLDKQVIIRSFKSESIKEITINKEKHTQLYFDISKVNVR